MLDVQRAIVNGLLQVSEGTFDSGGERDLNVWWSVIEIVVLIRDEILAAVDSMYGLAGDQLCQWNSVASDSILPAIHPAQGRVV